MRLAPRLAIGCVLAVVLAACSLARPEVARVGDREIGESQLERATALQAALAQLQGIPCGRPSEGESEDAACTRLALSSELLWLAVEDYAREHDLVATDRQVREAVEQLETQVGRGVLDDALASRSVGREQLDELGRQILTLRAVRTAVAEERVGDDELQALYEERIREFTFLDANHVLVRTRAEAFDVYRRVRNATEEEFMAVAREESIEPGAESTGGGLGRTAASGFVEAFADAALALDPGEVSRPVRTQFGWHVIYLVDELVTPYEEARADLIEPVADDEFQAWLEERAAELDVEVDPRYGRFDPRTFTLRPVRSTDPDATPSSPSVAPSP
jgi:parvulin-like peptidyl-prolyl isomerase